MLNDALRVLRILLPGNAVTADMIRSQVEHVQKLFPSVESDDLIRAATELYNIRADPWMIIEDKDRNRPWLDSRRANIDWRFWSRYRDYLQDEERIPPRPLRRLDELTDSILDKLFNPSDNSLVIGKRGLVVGQVQSGKTANYTGLICKAVDAGFPLVIVLAGLHNNLRAQTQLRLDEGFLGRDTQIERRGNTQNGEFGVSRFRAGLVAHSITSSLESGDFSAGLFNSLSIAFETSDPILLVVKKQKDVLNKLLRWLRSQSGIEVEGQRRIMSKSLLLIDDEADHASVNTNEDIQNATRINTQIRDVLRLFGRSAYVGYTATPFANLFIDLDRDELFPGDFVINLPPPSNYIGPERVFGFEPVPDDVPAPETLPVVHRISDFGGLVPRAERNAPLPNELPESLWLALRCYIITCAIRRLRGQVNVHNSMLIHTTRYVARQGALRDMVDDAFDYYRRGIAQNDAVVLEQLRQTFEQDTPGFRSFVTTSQQILDASELNALDGETAVHSWTDVVQHLHEAAQRIRVMTINGGSADVLNYFDHPDGLSVIAIGGDKLSRGLTLAGLSISYYLRASTNYDTLMQMGRWFGYRPGYVDLCRLFTSRTLNEWFCHITLASEELRREFDYMANVAGGTPRDFALKVRTHPGVLQITARNRMRRAVRVRVSFAGRLVETYKFPVDTEVLWQNYNHTRGFIMDLRSPDRRTGGHHIWERISPQQITDFLEGYSTGDQVHLSDPQLIVPFINLQTPDGELTEWTVALLSNPRPEPDKTSVVYSANGTDLPVSLFYRVRETANSSERVYYLRRSRIISPGHEFLDLTSEQLEQAKELTKALRKNKDKTGEPQYPNGNIVRNQIRDKRKGLLLLYSLDSAAAEAGLPADLPVIGYAISFPGSNYDNALDYAVHRDLLERFFQQMANTGNDEEEEEADDNR